MRTFPLVRAALASCGLALVLALAACAPKDPPKTLLFGNGAEPQDLDPQTVTGVVEHRLMNTFFEGLVGVGPQSDEVVPGTAERWDISPDGLTYTFHLRADAKWTNGDPVTAQDFVRSYQRMLTASLAADYAYMLFLIAGAEDYHAGRITDFAQVGAKAPDPRTLIITLRQPAPFLLNAMQHYAWFPIHPATVEKFGGMTRKGTDWTRPENFVGNGPFRMKSWQTGRSILAVRSETYWDRANVKLDAIRFFPVETSDTEERMFRAGQLHVTNEVPLSKIGVYQQTQPDSIKVEPYCGVYYYRYNVARAPFTDPRVRRALALAVDRDALVQRVTLAGEVPAYNIIPQGLGGFRSEHRLQGDLAEAKRLLAEAGYPDGKGFPKVELLYNTQEKHRTIAEALQQMWKQRLGVEITLYNEEWKVYLASQKTMNFQFQRAGWIGDYADPHVFFDLWRGGGGNNNTNWGNPEYDRLLAASLDAKTTEERYATYQKMEKIVLDELPILPLYIYTRARLISPKVIGYHTTYIDQYPWKYADLKE